MIIPSCCQRVGTRNLKEIKTPTKWKKKKKKLDSLFQEAGPKLKTMRYIVGWEIFNTHTVFHTLHKLARCPHTIVAQDWGSCPTIRCRVLEGVAQQAAWQGFTRVKGWLRERREEREGKTGRGRRRRGGREQERGKEEGWRDERGWKVERWD